MRFCRYCGKKVEDEEKICPACGKDITPAIGGRGDAGHVSSAGPVSAGPLQNAGVAAWHPDSARTTAAGADSGKGQQPAGSYSGELPQKDLLSEGKKKESLSEGKEKDPLSEAKEKDPLSEEKKKYPLSEGKKRYLIIAGIIAAVALLAVLILFSGRCRAEGCRNKKAPGSDYCYNHKCNVPDCRKERLPLSNYCYEHYDLYDEDAREDSGGAYSWQLNISDVRVYSEYSFTYAEGTLKNNSDETVKYVRIKGAFKTRMGTVVDTDWTYAVGSEGLAPGESCKWKMSVTKDPSITDCDVTVLESD